MNDTSAAWLFAIASVLLVSLLSFVGIVTLAVSVSRLKQVIFVMVSLAVGAMFGDAFIHLLPESFEDPRPRVVTSAFVLAGIFAFFFLEKFLLWRHQHTLDSDTHIHPVGYMNLIADGVHNFLDGILIGASYLISLQIGVATTAAVLLHEIPQEIGDFGVLLHAGFSRRRALLFNFLSGTLAIAGTLIALAFGSGMKSFAAVVLPLGAGGFIYIAGSDLIPELHKELKPSKSLVQLVSMALGAGLMWLMTLLE